jgi:uracil-DNA glycosylase family 4
MAQRYVQPSHDCPLCPRLAAFRQVNRDAYPDWFNGPVPSFGPEDAKLLIVGLAPGLKGANRTGRPFTGDYAGDLLYGSLNRHGLTRGTYQARPDDGFELKGVRISNAVRCVPPQNKPEPSEINTCRQFLLSELAYLKNVRVILSLGQISHNSVLSALGIRKVLHKFAFHVGGVAVIGMEDHMARFGLGLDQVENVPRWNALPMIVVSAPLRDAVNVGREI